MGSVRSLKSSPTTVYISHVRAQGSPEGRSDTLSSRGGGESNVAAVASDRFVPISPPQSRLPAHGRNSLVSVVDYQTTRLRRCILQSQCAVCFIGEVPRAVRTLRRLLLSWQRRLFRFPQLCSTVLSSPPAVEEAGAPLLLPPIESRVSSAHGAASMTLQPIGAGERQSVRKGGAGTRGR